MSNGIPAASGIYKITCLANKRIYIGSAVDLLKRKQTHFGALRQNKHYNPKLQNAWNKYGEETFVFEVLELVLIINLTAREQYWFNKLRPFGNQGFNIAHTAGSMLGVKHSPQARANMSKARQGWRPTPEQNERNRQANLGKRNSPEAREKMRQSALGRKLSPEHKEKLRLANLGRKRPLEEREKISQAQIGKKMSPEACEKIRQSWIIRRNKLKEVS